MTKELADFHVHYDAVHPETAYPIIDEAKQKNIAVLGLTARGDIPRVEDLQKIIEYGNKEGRTVVPGIEYPVKIPGNGSIDLIALRFDFTHPKIREIFGIEEYKQRNSEIARRQLNFLKSKDASLENLETGDKELLDRLLSGQEGTEKAIKFCRIVVHNPHNQNLVAELKTQHANDWKFVQTVWGAKPNYQAPSELDSKFLWYIWFREGQLGYKAQGENLASKPEDFVKVIHEANGVVLYSVEGKFNRAAWNYLKTIGINGVMAAHSGRLIQTSYSGGEEMGELTPAIIKELLREGYLVLPGSDFDILKQDYPLGKGHFFARRYTALQQHEVPSK